MKTYAIINPGTERVIRTVIGTGIVVHVPANSVLIVERKVVGRFIRRESVEIVAIVPPNLLVVPLS